MNIKELYKYYLTIPPTFDWNLLDKYIPEQYKVYFNGNKHFSFEEFENKLKDNYQFKLFIEERHFQKVIEEYIKRNACIFCYNKGNNYSGGYCVIDIYWKWENKPFIHRENKFSIN